MVVTKKMDEPMAQINKFQGPCRRGKYKHQITNLKQIPNFKLQKEWFSASGRVKRRQQNLEVFVILNFVYWDLFGIWCL